MPSPADLPERTKNLTVIVILNEVKNPIYP
jgi:hypothetical protein